MKGDDIMRKDLVLFASVIIGGLTFYGLLAWYTIRTSSFPWYSILATIVVTAALIVSIVVFVKRA